MEGISSQGTSIATFDLITSGLGAWMDSRGTKGILKLYTHISIEELKHVNNPKLKLTMAIM